MVVSNTLYMTRVSRSLEKGFQYATGMDLALVLEEANRYHLEWDDSEALFPNVKKPRDRRRARKNTGDLPISLKGEAVASSVWFHSDGERFVWSTEERWPDHNLARRFEREANPLNWESMATRLTAFKSMLLPLLPGIPMDNCCPTPLKMVRKIN
jgi:hypothetical protein